MRSILLLLLGGLLISCGGHQQKFEKNDPSNKLKDFKQTPTRLALESEIPNFIDDLDFAGLKVVIQRQLKRYGQFSASRGVVLGDQKYLVGDVVKSLNRFLVLANDFQDCLLSEFSKDQCQEKLDVSLRGEFNFYVPNLVPGDLRYGEEDPVFFTGYYTPTLEASKTKTNRFKHPIYAKPRSSALRKKTRAQIDFNHALKGHGLELFYIDDLFSQYLLHVEGGGKVLLADGTSMYLSYAGTNKQRWNFISKYMISKGMISDGSISSQRNYLALHPEHRQEVYSSCPSYVYFKKTVTPPFGNDNVPLTDRRSIATDRKLYPFKGLLTFVQTKRMRESDVARWQNGKRVRYRNYSRFYLDQDTGGAITGKGRVDLYFGEGSYAQAGSSVMKQRGDLMYLMLKPAPHEQ